MIITILLVFAFVCFALAVVTQPTRINLVALGLAFYAAAALFARHLIF